jgi:hypothetical protein
VLCRFASAVIVLRSFRCLPIISLFHLPHFVGRSFLRQPLSSSSSHSACVALQLHHHHHSRISRSDPASACLLLSLIHAAASSDLLLLLPPPPPPLLLLLLPASPPFSLVFSHHLPSPHPRSARRQPAPVRLPAIVNRSPLRHPSMRRALDRATLDHAATLPALVYLLQAPRP